MQSFAHEAATQAAFAPRRFAVAGSWCVELLPRNPYQAVYTPEVPIIGFAFDSQVGVHAFGSDRRISFRAKPNGLAYVPAGCDVYSSSDHGGEYLKITFGWEHDGPSSCTRRFSDVIDDAAIAAAQRLRRQLLARDHIDPLQCERFVHGLKERAACVLRGNLVESSAGSWMTPRRLKLVDDLVEARLDAKVTVQELASGLGLSAGFFSRALRAAIGTAPHDYIVNRRISRARALLQSTGLDLSAIAHACGFSSHAHMTATFRNRLGVSPGELRRRLAYSKHVS